MDVRHQNRILRIALLILIAALVAEWLPARGQAQRLPGPGSGVVDVSLVNDARVNAVQHGEWRVTQQGEWRANVQGTVATLPSMPPVIRAGERYFIQWPGHDGHVATLVALHPSGWAQVRVAGDTKDSWMNLTVAARIIPR